MQRPGCSPLDGQEVQQPDLGQRWCTISRPRLGCQKPWATIHCQELEAAEQGTAHRDQQPGAFYCARELRLAGTEPQAGAGQHENLHQGVSKQKLPGREWGARTAIKNLLENKQHSALHTHANGSCGPGRNASIPQPEGKTPSSHTIPSAPSTEQTKIFLATERCPQDLARQQ